MSSSSSSSSSSPLIVGVEGVPDSVFLVSGRAYANQVGNSNDEALREHLTVMERWKSIKGDLDSIVFLHPGRTFAVPVLLSYNEPPYSLTERKWPKNLGQPSAHSPREWFRGNVVAPARVPDPSNLRYMDTGIQPVVAEGWTCFEYHPNGALVVWMESNQLLADDGRIAKLMDYSFRYLYGTDTQVWQSISDPNLDHYEIYPTAVGRAMTPFGVGLVDWTLLAGQQWYRDEFMGSLIDAAVQLKTSASSSSSSSSAPIEAKQESAASSPVAMDLSDNSSSSSSGMAQRQPMSDLPVPIRVASTPPHLLSSPSPSSPMPPLEVVDFTNMEDEDAEIVLAQQFDIVPHLQPLLSQPARALPIPAPEKLSPEILIPAPAPKNAPLSPGAQLLADQLHADQLLADNELSADMFWKANGPPPLPFEF